MFTCGNCKREIATEGQFCPYCGTPAPRGTGTSPASPPAEPPAEVMLPDEPDPYLGQTVAGKYKILHLIDRGGMGQVYKATHLALDRPVALKMLNRALLADPTLVQRFHREARAASRLNHPNSIGIIDFGQMEDGTLFMVMELVPGRSLAQVIAEEFPLSNSRVVKIGSQILAALTEAHALGILHCDLKPQNIMLESRRDEPDAVKVVDFGIAKLTEARDGPKLTRAGTVVGTPGYMSPEQAQGDTLDGRSDIYSVGVILYELVTGKLPFTASSPLGLVSKMLSERPTPPSVRRPDMSIPPALEAVIMRALSPDRQARFPSAEEFRRQLLACSTSEVRTSPAAVATASVLREPLEPPARSPAKPPPPRTATVRPGPGRSPPRPSPPVPMEAERKRTPRGPRPAAHPAPLPLPRSTPPQGVRRYKDLAAALPIMIGSVVGAVGIGGLLVWLLTGDEGAGRPPRSSIAPVSEARPVPTAVAPSPAPPPPAAPPAAAPASMAPAPAQAVSQRADPAGGEVHPPGIAPAKKPPSAASPGPAVHASGDPETLATPPRQSGEGILTVLGPPGTALFLEGRRVGETPKELRLAQGRYRIRASHPGLGTAEVTMQVLPGERSRWQVDYGN